MAEARLVETIETGDALGEGVLWRAADSSVWWTDIEGRRLHRMAWPSLARETFETPERLGSFAFVARAGDVLAAAFETGFALYAPRSGKVLWLARLFEPGAGMRLNDGRVDPVGRFWAGSMVEASAARDERGALYRLDTDGSVSEQRRGLTISNGICWSPDGRRMHHSDSYSRTMFTAGYDIAAGAMRDVAIFARTERGAFPDGAVLDAAGVLWSALWGGGRLGRFAPSGARLEDVPVPASQPSCLVFGGPQLGLVFVTSARMGLDAEALARDPGAGCLFVYETDARGVPGVEAVIPRDLVDAIR